jgi:hypothetical protein
VNFNDQEARINVHVQIDDLLARAQEKPALTIAQLVDRRAKYREIDAWWEDVTPGAVGT